MNPRTGKMERIYVDLEMIYPEPDIPGTELSFEEVWARNRGWLSRAWYDEPSQVDVEMQDDDDEVEMTVEVEPNTRFEDSFMIEQQRRLQRERERERQREEEREREQQQEEEERELERQQHPKLQDRQPQLQHRLILSPRPKLPIHRDTAPDAPQPKLAVHQDAPSSPIQPRPPKMQIHCDTVVTQKQKLAIHRDENTDSSGGNASGNNDAPPVLSKKQKLSVHHDDGFGDENASGGLGRAPLRRSPKLPIQHDMNVDENGQAIQQQTRLQREVMDYNETQIIKAKLDSPSRPKIAKRKSMAAEPTMTIHTKAATDDIYDIFNAPLPSKKATPAGTDDDDDDGDDYDSDEYITDAESTMTTKNVDLDADEVEEVEDVEDDDDDDDDPKSDWSEFTTRKADDMTGKTNPDFTVRGVIGGDDDENDENSDDSSDVSSVEEVEVEFTEMGETTEINQSSHFTEHESSMQPDETEADHTLLTPTGSQQQPAHGEETQELPPPVQKYTITHTEFIPVPPEDYVAPTRPYRDPAEVANNRLPFMTPITERTEMSLDFQQMQGKTPSRVRGGMDTMLEEDEDDEDDEPLSSIGPSELLTSPLAILSKSPLGYHGRIAQPAFPPRPRSHDEGFPRKGPVITDVQVNPMASNIRQQILDSLRPPLRAYAGFFDHSMQNYEKGNEIRRFARAMSKAKASGDAHASPVIRLPDSRGSYTVKKELGAGAFAPVYLVENSAPGHGGAATAVASGEAEAETLFGAVAPPARQRSSLEALKMETPPSTWEFFMMRLAHRRLGAHDRAAASLSYAHELHLYRDEGFLVLPFHPHGTLLDVVNLFRAEPSGVMDEQLAMFFTVELLRTVEALHGKGIMHGDLKADNCLLRIDGPVSVPFGAPAAAAAATSAAAAAAYRENSPNNAALLAAESVPLTAPYQADGSGGWAARGVTLIDFGRGIDMRAFAAADDVQFIGDWKTTAHDCAEVREGRPWTWHIDYHGLAGIVHTLLFGKYIETARVDQMGGGSSGGGGGGGLNVGGPAAGRRYRVRENVKRYWQTEIWVECFDLLLNPGLFVQTHGEDGRLPVTRGLKAVREKMEAWLVANSERGTGLRTLLNKVEVFAKGRR